MQVRALSRLLTYDDRQPLRFSAAVYSPKRPMCAMRNLAYQKQLSQKQLLSAMASVPKSMTQLRRLGQNSPKR